MKSVFAEGIKPNTTNIWGDILFFTLNIMNKSNGHQWKNSKQNHETWDFNIFACWHRGRVTLSLIWVQPEPAGWVGGPPLWVCTEVNVSHSCMSRTSLQQQRKHIPVGDRGRTNQSSFHSGSEEMAGKKAILFNFWGVTVSSGPHAVFHKLEELHNLPG